jgi:YVTN family beta-propeller protein
MNLKVSALFIPILRTASPRGRGRIIRASLATLGLLAALMAVTAGPANAATSLVGTSVYVPNVTAGTVSVLNGSTDTITATVPVGADPIDTAVTPDGSQVLSANEGAGTVSVISTATDTVTATIPVTADPDGVVVAPSGTTAYASSLAGGGLISVISLTTDTVTGTIPTGLGPNQMVINSAGTTLYVDQQAQSNVLVISLATDTVTATVNLNTSQNWEMALSPDGSKLYIASGDNFSLPGNDSSIEVLSTATNTVTATISLGSVSYPTGLAISPDGSTIYTADQFGNSVSVISTATDTVTSTITGFSGATGIALTPNGTTAYVSDVNDNTVKVLNTATGTITATISGFSVPYLISQHTSYYPFTGFFPPVRNSPAVNQAVAGWIIPLTFQLGGSQGLNIFNPGDPAVQQVNCTTGAPIGTASPAQPVGHGLYYIGPLGTYAYLWQTSSAWKGTCQEFILGLNDGSTHTAVFNFNLRPGVPWPFASRAVQDAQARAASASDR